MDQLEVWLQRRGLDDFARQSPDIGNVGDIIKADGRGHGEAL